MKIKAIQEYYERNCEKHGNGKVMATVSSIEWVLTSFRLFDHATSEHTNLR